MLNNKQQPFNEEQILQEYQRLMDAGPLAENEHALAALVDHIHQHGYYVDYDRTRKQYALVAALPPEAATSLLNDEQSYSDEAIEKSIAELRATPGVTIDSIEHKPLFNVVIVWGQRVTPEGTETGAIEIFRKSHQEE